MHGQDAQAHQLLVLFQRGGGGIGRLFKLDKLPINAQLQAFYNVVKPDAGANWTLRFQVQALFPAH